MDLKQSLASAALIVSLSCQLTHADLISMPRKERSKLPPGLTCKVDDPGARGPFVVTHLNTLDSDPDWNGDGSFEGMDLAGATLSFDFNNGCDDNYTFILVFDDLVKLAKGQAKEVVGLLNYFNSYGENPDNGYTNTGTSPMHCTLLSPAFN